LLVPSWKLWLLHTIVVYQGDLQLMSNIITIITIIAVIANIESTKRTAKQRK
jgi:hypothetical protein